MGDFMDGKKKFSVSLVASILSMIGLLNGFTVAEIAIVVGPLTGYVLGQGMADNGKEATRQRVKSLLKYGHSTEGAEGNSGDH